mgnify:CR=1 FL=1
MTRPRRSLFVKYFVTLFVAVVVPLVLGAGSEAWFAFRAHRLHLNEVLQVEARAVLYHDTERATRARHAESVVTMSVT